MISLRSISKTAAFVAIALLASGAGAAEAEPDANAGKATVVLVHGAFADGSSWNKVIPLLQAKAST